MEYIEKLNTKKEYTAPQMEVVSCDVRETLLNGSPDPDPSVDVILDND